MEEFDNTNTNTNTSTTTKTRRTNSLVLTRTSIPPILKPRSRRTSLSLWRSRPTELETTNTQLPAVTKNLVEDNMKPTSDQSEKTGGGLWNWKPIRALSHIGKQKLSCLLSFEVVTIQGLPASMSGLRLSVSVRKKETKDGAIQTMPSRVSQGAADFEETLFVRSHVYCTPADNGNSRPKFEPRPFVIHAFVVDAQELDFGRHTVDLSQLIQESEEKNLEGTRIRQWDMSFNLSGKAKGGELVMKLGFQIMEKEGGAEIYNQVEAGQQKTRKSKSFSPSSFGRKQSRSSFSIPSPRIHNRAEVRGEGNVDFQDMDELNLDAPPQEPVSQPPPPPPPPVQKTEEEPESKAEDLDLPDFEGVDKGVGVEGMDGTLSEDDSDKRSVSSEVLKEIGVDSIAPQIKASESMMGEDKTNENDEDTESQRLDEDEDKVTREFLQTPENEDGKETVLYQGGNVNTASSVDAEDEGEPKPKVFIPVLGKGLGCVVLCLGALKLLQKLVTS